MSDATIIVNGDEHRGWTDISVTRSLEQLAHTFELSYVDQWSTKNRAIAIREGDVCKLKLNDKSITQGFVIDAPLDYDANDHTMKISGISRTGDLVDCSAVHKGQWLNRDIEQIANDLCGPFAISVKIDADIGDKFNSFALTDGETVFEALERACRMRGVLMTTSPTGDLVFARIGAIASNTVIERGVNVLRGGRSSSWKDRYSKYVVKAQAPGDDDFNGAAAAQGKVEVTDSVIDRYRPLVVLTECQSAGPALTKRANWERNVRAARGQRLKYTLDGWTDDDGAIWAPNTIVRVRDDFLEVDTELLIVSAKQVKNRQDESTELELCDPMAMTTEPLSVQTKKAKESRFIEAHRP